MQILPILSTQNKLFGNENKANDHTWRLINVNVNVYNLCKQKVEIKLMLLLLLLLNYLR